MTLLSISMRDMDLPIRIPLETTPNETSEVSEDGSDLLNRSHANSANNATSQPQLGAPDGNLYQPLPTGESIRLLRLQPGPRDELISCNLQPANFNDNLPAYEALSYVWGSSSDTRSIICNGREIAVTRNLRNALRRLRRRDSTRLIWVDAICINQRNDEERGHQVRHMGSIYQCATRVLIWLGKDESEKAEQAFLLVCSIANRNKKFEGSPQGDLETNHAASPEGNADNNSVENSGKDIATFIKDSIKEPFSNSGEPPPWDSSLWEPVKSLFDKSWFTRMWGFRRSHLLNQLQSYGETQRLTGIGSEQLRARSGITTKSWASLEYEDWKDWKIRTPCTPSFENSTKRSRSFITFWGSRIDLKTSRFLTPETRYSH